MRFGMMIKSVIVVIGLMAISAEAGLGGDFAPLVKGNTWVYLISAIATYTDVRTICLDSIPIDSSISTCLFSVRDSGEREAEVRIDTTFDTTITGDTIKDTTIVPIKCNPVYAMIQFDTSYQIIGPLQRIYSEDTVSMPVWCTHSLDSYTGHINIEYINNAPVNFFQRSSFYSQGSMRNGSIDESDTVTYVSGIGMIRDIYNFCSSGNLHEETYLIKFNSQTFAINPIISTSNKTQLLSTNLISVNNEKLVFALPANSISTTATLHLYQPTGRCVATFPINQSNKTNNTFTAHLPSNLSAGTYIYRFEGLSTGAVSGRFNLVK